jgi:hypothetical protein
MDRMENENSRGEPGCSCLKALKCLCLGGCQGLEAGVEAALVAGDGVLVEDALLDALVERGDGQAVLLLSGLDLTLGQSLAERAQAGAHAAAVGAVDGGAGLSLTGALERRNVICHCLNSLKSPRPKGRRTKEMMRDEKAQKCRIPRNFLVYGKNRD